MTLIFGSIDFPVFEAVLIVSVLNIIGLFIILFGIFYILKDLKKLKKLVKEEEEDIKEFEADIAKLEKFESLGNKDEDIKKYIKDNLSKGYKWPQLRESLIKQGWEAVKLDQIYQQLIK